MLAHIRIRDMRQRNYCTNTISHPYPTYRHHITLHHNSAALLLIPADSRQTKILIRCLRFRTQLIYTSQRIQTQGNDDPLCRCRGPSPTAPTIVQKYTVVEFTACRHRRPVPRLAPLEWRRSKVLRLDWHRARQVNYVQFAETPRLANITV